ncbi:Reverse transcriptase (RNA-dependent DNA polymerase) [Fragilaria crotonensis]|nr:Reverse transcriptase (RNA-dependent DNA polymerase) [Fragilaria crotonensis]
MASCDLQDTFNAPSAVTSWPDVNAPQMEINRALLNNDFLPSAPNSPPNTGSTELFPEDPLSTHQRFGPPSLDNWLPDSGATCHYTPVFSDLRDVEACHIPVSLADGTTKISTFKGTDCYFTSDEGQKSILGLTDVYYIEAYLFIVTTPGKLTGWIGLPTESTTSIITALKSWLTQTELLGRTKSVRFIRTDAGSAFTSAKFITECTNLGIKLEAAAPEHQEMNGICEAKWREVHNTANVLLNTARLGGAFFHHAHAYAVSIINACPAKNVTDQHGNPTTPSNTAMAENQALPTSVFGCPVYFKRYEPTFRNKLITYKQQLQRASRGIFIGFENSAGWLVYSPDHPQRIVITRDAYFDEDFSSALAFDSKPFAGAIPIRSHLDPNGLQSLDNSEPSIVHQTGSAANLGITPSTYLEELHDSEQLYKHKTMALQALPIQKMILMTLIPSQNLTSLLDQHHQLLS